MGMPSHDHASGIEIRYTAVKLTRIETMCLNIQKDSAQL